MQALGNYKYLGGDSIACRKKPRMTRVGAWVNGGFPEAAALFAIPVKNNPHFQLGGCSEGK